MNMWENPRVLNHKLHHPFLWPWYVLAGIIGLYVIFLSVFFYLYKTEKNNPSHALYQKALEIRKQELTNLKLSGIEPYVWKPLFKCQSLEQKRRIKEKNEDCIKVSMAFVKSAEKETLGKYIYEEPSTVKIQEETAGPCLICHRKKNQTAVEWTFHYKEQRPTVIIASLWENKDFIYFHAVFWSLMALYILIRLGFRLTHGNDLIAIAVRSSRKTLADEILSARLKTERKYFVYIEISTNFINGYIPRRHLIRIYKKYFTGEFDYSDLDLRIGIVEYNTLSFEGFRIAQAVASKALSSSAIIQEKILAIEPGREMKKAVWKRKDSQLNFNIVEIKKINDGLDGNKEEN